MELAATTEEVFDDEATADVIVDADALITAEDETAAEEEMARFATEFADPETDTAAEAEARFLARGVIWARPG